MDQHLLARARACFDHHAEVSVAVLQRGFSMGYASACSLMQHLEHAGLVTMPLPEGFRVLARRQVSDTLRPLVSEMPRYARSVFETALYLVETSITGAGHGRSDTLQEIIPANFHHWSTVWKLLPRIPSIITTSIDISGSNLLIACRWLMELDGDDCAPPPYTFAQVEEILSEKCAWWARANCWLSSVDKIEADYMVGLMASARYLHRIHREAGAGGGGHSRLELFVRDELRAPGASARWLEQTGVPADRREAVQVEHVVPSAFIRDNCLRLYGLGASVNQVAQYIDRHMVRVNMLASESRCLDTAIGRGGLGLKSTMPAGWRVGVDSIFARLHAAGIAFAPPPWYQGLV